MKKHKLWLGSLLIIGLLVALGVYLSNYNVALLNPKGTIAEQQRNLMLVATLLMLIIVIPVFVMLAIIPWKYRESNHKARYTPDWDGNKAVETAWWLVPLGIILILAGITYKSSHQLDPFRPIQADNKPLTIQVIALQWKWLFIYPEHNIAIVNRLYMPKDTPVNFEITADAPMNSFWIPQLGGQVYAMSGMKTQLHLIANQPGTYVGSSANISGRGFSGMKFTAEVGSDKDFNNWVESARFSQIELGDANYHQLALPSKNTPVTYYGRVKKDLFSEVIMKYMGPMKNHSLDHQHAR